MPPLPDAVDPTNAHATPGAAGQHDVVTAERPVAGGEMLARDDGGVVLLTGAVPGDRVRVSTPAKVRGARRATVIEVLDPSADRTRPPCPHVAEGCGGCDWQHVLPARQPALKGDVVRDALARLGGLSDARVDVGPALDPGAHRTTVRAGVAAGRAGFRQARSHDVVVPDTCGVAHPGVDEVLTEGRFPGADEVTIRVGAATGERLALVSPRVGDATVPDGVRLIGDDELTAGRRAWYHDEVCGRRWRISARSFFQARPDGAAALVAAVRAASGDALRPGVRLVDAYGGVGLFTGVLLAEGGPGQGGHSEVVERSASSAADARVNLADIDHRVVRVDVDRWRATPADLVVADPARSGLGARGVRSLTATGAPVLVLVSCDAASLGRDARLLADAGYDHAGSTVIDLFPQTHHVEVVTRFERR